MSGLSHHISLFCASVLVPGMIVCGAETGDAKDRKIAQLERRVATLSESYALARKDADEARQALREIRARLEALGGSALGGSEERLIEVVSQLEASRARHDALTRSSQLLLAALAEYMRGALVDDIAARSNLESAMRETELALGLRTAPQDQMAGTVDNAQVLSIDTESGLVVINAGREAKVQVGMPMQITRGDQAIALAVVTDVRKEVAGMLVQKHLSSTLSVKVGDRVSITNID